MDFSAAAFVSELASIKVAQADTPEQKARWTDLAKNVGQSIGAGAAGAGAGAALGYGGLELLKRYHPSFRPGGVPLTASTVKNLRRGAGLLTGLSSLAAMIAFQKAQKRYEKVKGE